MTSRVLHPLTYKELFIEAFSLYKENFKLYLGIAAIIVIPSMILSFATPKIFLFNFLVGLITGVGYYASGGAIAKAVAQKYLGNSTSIFNAYKFLNSNFKFFFLTMLVTDLIISLGLFLLIIPGIIFAFWYVFISQIYVIEGLSGKDARTRSKQLIGGFCGKIFIVGLIIILIHWVIRLLLGTPLITVYGPTAITFKSMYSRSDIMLYIVNRIIDIISATIVSPIAMISFTLLYFDIRVRKEGFDLNMLAQNLENTQSTQLPEPTNSSL